MDAIETTLASASMNNVFYWCVDTLKFYAGLFGMTYEEINVWIFCIIEPIVFLAMLIVIIRQARKLHKAA